MAKTKEDIIRLLEGIEPDKVNALYFIVSGFVDRIKAKRAAE